MNTETKYLYIPENTISAYKISQENMLTPEDIAKITANRFVFAKFIRQKALSIQFDIWMWKWAENTWVWFKVVEQLEEIAKDIGKVKEIFDNYLIQQIKEKEEAEAKAREDKEK